MKNSPLLKLSVAIAPESEDAILELLANLFGVPASIYTNTETRATSAIVYLERRSAWNEAARRALRAGIRQIASFGLDVGTGRISTRIIRREDWAESWKRHFPPLKIGRRLLIQPSWIRRRPLPGQELIVLDPGLSFGTGQHPTTRFCLRQLTQFRKRDEAQSLLDVGTGTGILAIAAAKLGYSPVTAWDFDIEAVRSSRANAATNGVEDRIELKQQDVTRLSVVRRPSWDVVCANLTYDLLIECRDVLLSRLKPDGLLVLAGILRTQFPEVAKAYRKAGLQLTAERQEREWHSAAWGRSRGK